MEMTSSDVLYCHVVHMSNENIFILMSRHLYVKSNCKRVSVWITELGTTFD